MKETILDTSAEYPHFFRTMISALTRQSLVAVEAASYSVSTTVRDQALHVLNFAMQWEGAWVLASKLLLALAPKMELMGHRHDWIPYLKWGAEQATQRGELAVAAECQLQIGLLYRMLSEFDSAITWVNTSIDNFKTIGVRHGQACALNELAWIEHLQHRYKEATRHAEEALSLLDMSDSERGMSYRVLGLVAHDQNQFVEAEVYHRHSLSLLQIERDDRKISWALQNLANALRNQSRFDEAIEYYQRAMRILITINDQYHLAMVKMNLGTIYCNHGRAEDGLRCHADANVIFTKLNDLLGMAKSNTGLGIARLMLNDFSTAELLFKNSVEQFASLKNESLRLNAVDGLARAYLVQGKYVEARIILTDAIASLHRVLNAPNYDYLQQSLKKNLEDLIVGERQILTISRQ